jgi:hypothetical protein
MSACRVKADADGRRDFYQFVTHKRGSKPVKPYIQTVFGEPVAWSRLTQPRMLLSHPFGR